MAKKPGEPESNLTPGQYRELAAAVLKQLPIVLDPKLVQYLIDHPLFTRAALEQWFSELQVPSLESSWSGLLHIKDDFDANDALQKAGAVQGKKSALALLEKELSVRPKGEPAHPHEYWSLKPTRSREVKIMMRARKHRPASPFELVAYIARGWRPQGNRKSLVSLAPIYVDHQPHVLMYSGNAERQLCWTIEHAERVWPMTVGFLALGQE